MPNQAPIELRSASPSLLMRAVKWIMKRRKPVFPHTAEGFAAEMSRRKLPADAPLPDRIARKHSAQHWEAAGQAVVTLHPRSGPGEWQMIYFHGGGFILPMFDVHWPLVAALVDATGASVTVPLYDVVPEHKQSRQDELADAVFAAIAANHDPARIVLGGDSAGGHMALSLALRLAREGGAQAGRLALFAPWLDLALQDPRIAEVEPHDMMLKIGTLRACGEMVADGRGPAGPLLSPLYAPDEDLALLPPTRIWTGRHDLFIVDSRTFTQRLCTAGVDAKLYEYEGAPHVFMAITPTREAKDVVRLVREFLSA